MVDWVVVSSIFVSWLISPLIGGIIAAGFLAFIKINLIYQEDKIAAARRWVPVLVALMAAIFAAYLVIKGLKPCVEAGLSRGRWHQRPGFRPGLSRGEALGAQPVGRAWRTAIRLCGSCSTCR